MTWAALSFLASALTPLSFLPSLRRSVRLRTADGLTDQLCLLGLTSYGAWLSLAWGVQLPMYVTLVVSAVLSLLQFALVLRYAPAPPSLFLVGVFAVVSACALAARWLLLRRRRTCIGGPRRTNRTDQRW